MGLFGCLMNNLVLFVSMYSNKKVLNDQFMTFRYKSYKSLYQLSQIQLIIF